ncbi:MAG: glycosyltransferase [Thermoanaerobaculia bacterium]|nr:glycosyltransferase [Thermoanaerobaculia bacterium]
MTEPVVGIVVPCYNHGRFAGECVASLEAQTFRDWTAVVIDDGSDDGETPGLLETLASDRVRVVRFPGNRGLSAVRREGFRLLGHLPYHLAVDADDVIEPAYVEKLLRAMEGAPESAGVFGTQHYFGESRLRPEGGRWPTEAPEPAERYFKSPAPGSGTLLRSEAVRAVPGWRAELSGLYEDWEFALQLLDAGWRIDWIPDAVYRYRRHAGALLESWSLEKTAHVHSLLLGLHLPGIAATVGVREFLSRKIVPVALGSLRAGRIGLAAGLLGRALRAAPLDTLSLTTGYYVDRLRGRTSRDQEGPNA